MKVMLSKLNKKIFVQNILIEVTADVIMVALGFMIAYYVKTML